MLIKKPDNYATKQKVKIMNPEPQMAWLIFFEDADRDVITFTDKGAAEKTHAILLGNWNCHLFEMVSFNGVCMRDQAKGGDV